MSTRTATDRSGGGRLLFGTDDERWQAVARRDTSAGGVFLYGVRTTGVFCRPGCASKLPHRHHVVFFAGPTEAASAGFRPCKRCQPAAPLAPDPDAEVVRQACALLDESVVPPALQELAAAVGLSAFHFHRLFTRTMGVTPKAYAVAQQRRRLQEGLTQGDSVTRAIHDSGFGSSSRVYERTDTLLGMAPARYRAGAPGERVRYAVERVSLGWLLVAATERGLCAVELGDTPDALLASLRRRFARADLITGDTGFAAWVAQVVALVESPRASRASSSLPLDLQGTAFQQRVWQALREILPGTTASYGELARRIGQPAATRAVAQACGANPVAVVIPCHRVVRGDGALGGYRWGLARKRALLEREAATT